ALTLAQEVGVKAASEQLKIAKGTIYDWRKQADAIWTFEGHSTSKTLKGQGHKEIFPGVSDLLTYMKDVRRDEADLSTSRMIQYMWKIHLQWMTSYMNEKKEGAVSIERMVQHIDNRYGFTSQNPKHLKSYKDLEETKALFAIEFWKKYSSYWGGSVLNGDETAIMFDMPLIKAWAGRGRKDSARILGANKHAGRMTAARDNANIVFFYVLFIF
ncbi:hypothetical protein PHMEG_00021180, partial [Phytophthora megakarya]